MIDNKLQTLLQPLKDVLADPEDRHAQLRMYARELHICPECFKEDILQVYGQFVCDKCLNKNHDSDSNS